MSGLQKSGNIGNDSNELDSIETREWLESLDYVLQHGGTERAQQLLKQLEAHARRQGVDIPFSANTPYVNSIPPSRQSTFPGNHDIERSIRSIIRWNALAMVVRANRQENGIGGHISTYASAASLYEIGFNHFFRARTADHEGDLIYYQGHATPGIYARAFLEGRLTVKQLENFRRELADGGGLSSYPHPYLMPDFWSFPTVSMGLSPIMAIYQARFIRYLEDRGLKQPSDAKIWAFLGDGETDEPETLGAISLAAREKLDNLIFVINCNLQRLDGPVRGNGKIIQELERNFRGTGWNVIKLIWGSEWDHLFGQDQDGLLVKRLDEVVDGQFQKYSVESGAYIRADLFGKDPRLLKIVENLTDEELRRMKRGGHDPEKIYSAYKSAVENRGTPTVILAKTVKGYGMGKSGEGKNISHQQKKLSESELHDFRDRFDIPITDRDIEQVNFYHPGENSPEVQYMKQRRQMLGGSVPVRHSEIVPLKALDDELFEEFYKGSDNREVSTTMVIVRILTKLLRTEELGKLIVPIVPDEARTFGMESLFRQHGIYSHIGQLYEPVDADSLMYYKESQDGQILEEGITEAGAMSSFIAAGSAYATFGVNTIPFYLFYSMFGFQRIGDLIWAAADMQCRGFLVGATAGRTTLAGEGLQHQDGHSHLTAYSVPNIMAYDPAFAYEVAVIVRDGIQRMYQNCEKVFYYITVQNENYPMPEMPKPIAKIKEGIVKGMYKFSSSGKKSKLRVNLFGSGSIMNEVLKAQKILEEKFDVGSDVWSVTSYKQLYRDAIDCERHNMLHPGSQKPWVPYITECLEGTKGVFVAASDYVKALPDSIARWIPGKLTSLGTDGFGRSEGRAALRDFFEVDHRFIVVAVLASLSGEKEVPTTVVTKAMKEFGIDPNKPNPLTV